MTSLSNINTFHPSLQPLITEFTGKLIRNLGDNLQAVLVYGSAAGPGYNPGVSNLNIAVIVKNLDFMVLKQNFELIRKSQRQKIATPLFLTKEYVLSSLDVFPLEFKEIKDQHRLVWGEDIFSGLDIPDKDIRLLCEQQVKGKLLHLRQAYLEIGPRPAVLKKMLMSALNDLMPVFRQLVILKGQEAPLQKEDLLKSLSQTFSLDLQPFMAVYQDKHKKVFISPHEVEAHLENFLAQLEKLARHLDSL